MQKNIKFIKNLSAQLGKSFQKRSVSCTCQQFIQRNVIISNQSISSHRQSTPFLAMRNFHQTKYLQNANQQPEDIEPNNEKQQPPKKKAGQLAKVFAEYGTTAVVFHTTISLTSLGICYTAVSRYNWFFLLIFHTSSWIFNLSLKNILKNSSIYRFFVFYELILMLSS